MIHPFNDTININIYRCPIKKSDRIRAVYLKRRLTTNLMNSILPRVDQFHLRTLVCAVLMDLQNDVLATFHTFEDSPQTYTTHSFLNPCSKETLCYVCSTSNSQILNRYKIYLQRNADSYVEFLIHNDHSSDWISWNGAPNLTHYEAFAD